MTERRSDLDAGLGLGVAGAVLFPAGAGVEAVPARRATRSVVAVLVSRLVAAACGVIVTVILTRHLGPDRFGELSVVLSVAMLASSVGELGTTSVIAAEMAARPDRRRQLAAGVAVLRTVAGAVTGLAAAVVLGVILDRPAARWAGVAVVATVPLAGISALAVVAQARLRPEVGAALSLGQSAAWLVAVALSAAAGGDVAVLGLAFLACGIGQAGATWLVVARRERPAWAEWRPAARWTLTRCWPLAVATVLGAMYYRLDGLFVFRLQGAHEAGVYAAAYRFLDVSQLVPIAIVSVVLPLLGRRWSLGDRAGFEALVRLALTAGAAVGALVAAGALVCGGRLAPAVFGANYAASGDVLGVLGLAVFSLATGFVYSAALVAAGDVKVVGFMSAVALVVSVAAGVPAITRWGAAGAAWVTVGTEYLVSTTLGVRLHRRHRLRFPLRRVGASIAAGAVAVAAGWPLRGLPAVVLVAVCTGVYCVAAAGLGAVTRGDLSALRHPRLALGTPG